MGLYLTSTLKREPDRPDSVAGKVLSLLCAQYNSLKLCSSPTVSGSFSKLLWLMQMLRRLKRLPTQLGTTLIALPVNTRC